MIQLILTYAFIAYAVGYILFHTYKMIIPVKQSHTGCSTGCSSCSVKPFEIQQKKIDASELTFNG